MVSYKNYNLNVDEDFVIFLTSKLITFLIDGFTFRNEIPLNGYLLGGSAHIYIGYATLKVKCTQYGICSQAAFKNARAFFFCFRAGRASVFGRV